MSSLNLGNWESLHAATIKLLDYNKYFFFKARKISTAEGFKNMQDPELMQIQTNALVIEGSLNIITTTLKGIMSGKKDNGRTVSFKITNQNIYSMYDHAQIVKCSASRIVNFIQDKGVTESLELDIFKQVAERARAMILAATPFHDKIVAEDESDKVENTPDWLNFKNKILPATK